MSEYFNISKNHMMKITHNLSKKKYINTKKGKGGGIELARESSEINIGELVREIEPDLHIAECFDASSNKCRITEICKLKKVLSSAKKAFMAELDSQTLADIAPSKEELQKLIPYKGVI